MRKWQITSIVLAVVLVFVLISAVVINRNAALNWVCDQCGFVQPEIGTNIGPGQGHIYFPIRDDAITRVEAIAVVPVMPKKGDTLEANSCLNQTIKGEVVSIPEVSASRNKAIVTILAYQYDKQGQMIAHGLVTVGVVRLL